MKKYILLIFMFSTMLYASSISTGLGENFSTLTGVEALGNNPAAVNADSTRLSLNFRGKTGLQNNLVPLNEYISEEYKNELFDNIADTGWVINQDANVGIDIKIGWLAVSVSGKDYLNVNLADDMGKILLEGVQIGEKFSIDGTKAAGAGFADVGINLSRTMGKNRIGMTYHYLTGVVASLEVIDGDITIDYYDDDTIGPKLSGEGGEIIYSLSDPTQGMATGHSLDLGIYRELRNGVLGFSIMNIGKLTAESGIIDSSKMEIVFDEDGSFDELKEVEEVGNEKDLVYILPLIYNFGYSRNITRKTELLLGYKYTKFDEFIDIAENRYSVGLKLEQLGILPIRLGLNYSDLSDSFGWSTGVGLHLFAVKADVGLTFAEKDVNVGVSTRLEF